MGRAYASVLLLLQTFFVPSALAALPTSRLLAALPDRATLISDFDAFVGSLRILWANRDVHEKLDRFDLNQRASATRNALHSGSVQEASVQIQRFVHGLHDGHLWVGFPDATYVRKASRMKFAFSRDGLLLTSCEDGCPGLPLPAQVLRLDGVPAETWLNRQAESAPGSTHAGRRHRVLLWLSELYMGLAGERRLPELLSVVPSGSSVPQELRIPWETVPYFPPRDDLNCISSRVLQETLILRVTNFDCGARKEERSRKIARFKRQLDKALRSGHRQKRILLDLRGNPGGYFEEAEALASRLISKPMVYYRSRSRTETFPKLHANQVRPARIPSWLQKAPLWLLVDGGCFSQCSLFVRAMEAVGRARTIGSEIDAGAGGSLPWQAPEKSFIAGIPSWEVLGANGWFIEGSARAPDLPLLPEMSSFRQHRDPLLMEALAVISPSRE